VSRDELQALVAGAGVLVHPAADEPFGRAVLEAMACATPVAAADSGGPRELLAKGGGALVRPGDVEGLAAAALEYVRNPGRAHAAGERGRAAVLANYTAAMHAKAMEEVYASVTRDGGKF
jgi:glycosyltransferase involved in cell wall biosynthesis